MKNSKPMGMVVLLLLLCATSASAETFDRWAIHDESSKLTVNHEPMTRILDFLVVKDKKKEQVAYGQMAGPPLEYANLYIDYLQSLPVSDLNRDEQLAYWLNLHNIGVVRTISQTNNGHSKVKKLRGTPLEPGEAWLTNQFTVEAQPLSLQGIEHDVLIRTFGDPLIIYGLYLGVSGSPQLGDMRFTGDNVREQLFENGKKYVASASNVRATRGGLIVSSVYDWHKSTLFNGEDSQIADHIVSLSSTKLASKIEKNPSIKKYQFKWRSTNWTPRAARSGVGGIGGTSRSGAGS